VVEWRGKPFKFKPVLPSFYLAITPPPFTMHMREICTDSASRAVSIAPALGIAQHWAAVADGLHGSLPAARHCCSAAGLGLPQSRDAWQQHRPSREYDVPTTRKAESSALKTGSRCNPVLARRHHNRLGSWTRNPSDDGLMDSGSQ
jgi:hypothetical protein